MNREALFRAGYKGVYSVILFFSWFYSIWEIIIGLELRVVIIDNLSFIMIAAIMFGLIYWQFPKYMNDKIEERKFEIRMTKQHKKEPKKNRKKARQAPKTSTPDLMAFSHEKTGNKKKNLWAKISYIFTGTRRIKAGWINIMFIIGLNIVTFLLFYIIATIFTVYYSLAWIIVNIIYSLILTLVCLIPLKLYHRVLIDQLIED